MSRPDSIDHVKARCTGKECFTAQRAHVYLRTKKRRHAGVHLVAYHCKTCGWWHLGETERLPAHETYDQKRQRRYGDRYDH